MKQIAVIIPTYKRPQKLLSLIDNFEKNSTQAQLYFVVHPGDTPTIQELNKIQLNMANNFTILNCSGEYVECINYAYQNTQEEFIFCGADDILFSSNWDQKLLEVMKNDKINVTGGVDDWPCSHSGVHISHPMFRRSYCETLGASWGGGTKEIYFSGYKHYQCDIETENMALNRECLAVCNDCFIDHVHFCNGKASHDYTYDNSKNNCFAADTNLYTNRCQHFELFDRTQVTVYGNPAPSQWRKERLSIVMPIWNCAQETKNTLQSLIARTHNKWELILIDDASTEFNPQQFLNELKQMAYSGGFTSVVTHCNDHQKFCNANWNQGVAMSHGDYVAVVNNDIEVECSNWDQIFIEDVKNGYELVSPFERNRVYPQAYQQSPLPSPVHHLNLRGCFFMMARGLINRAFPINAERYQHWCGDNVISANAQTWIFDNRVSVLHYLSKSSAKINPEEYTRMTQRDILHYMADFDDYSLIKLVRQGDISISNGKPTM